MHTFKNTVHDVAADADVYTSAKQKKSKNLFVDRVCENLIREVWQKRNLRVKSEMVRADVFATRTAHGPKLFAQ